VSSGLVFVLVLAGVAALYGVSFGIVMRTSAARSSSERARA
jgi:hypothetical protein